MVRPSFPEGHAVLTHCGGYLGCYTVGILYYGAYRAPARGDLVLSGGDLRGG
jgi:hypothetical protein